MQINKLKLNNFRNFEKYTLKPEKVNLLLGPNGVGKTNLIEAIYLLSVCRSYRTRRDHETVRWGDDCRFELDSGSHEILNHIQDDETNIVNTARVEMEATSDKGDDINIAVAQTGEKKIALVSNKSVPVSMLVGILPTVIFNPESMDLPEAPPTKRRRTLDVLLAQIDPKYTQTLLRYNQIIKARNKLLDGISKGRNKENELDFWDKQLIDLGTKILTARLGVVKELNSLVGKSYGKLCDGNQDDNNYSSLAITQSNNKPSIRKLSFEYLSTIENIDRFEEELVAVREQELRYGNTVIGPHRDDWQMKFSGVDIRMSASRGETRAALLALKMAEMEILYHHRKELPILLLDDVFAELDKRHSESLLGFFDGNQTFITATDAEYIPKSIMEKAKVIKL